MSVREIYQKLIKYLKFLPKPGVDDNRLILINEAFDLIDPKVELEEDSLINISAARCYTWENLHIGPWDQVDCKEKEIYAVVTFLEVVLQMKEFLFCDENDSPKLAKNFIINCLKSIDMGILLGEPIKGETHKDLLCFAASLLSQYLKQTVEKGIEFQFKNNLDSDQHFNTEISVEEIPLSLEEFNKKYYDPGQPVLIKDVLKNWPASQKWKELKYFQQHFGFRTVPIEIGNQYTQEDWGQQLITFNEFLESQFINQDTTKVMYLAQHDILKQIPELREDIKFPDLLNDLKINDPDIKIWFGPGNTVSPLHYDKKENFLCQIFGWKKIILADSKETEKLYPFTSEMMTNTSQIDLTKEINGEEFPLAKEVQFKQVLLSPGDMLFIPYGWWHFVTSLTPSISISFWWNKENS